MLSNNNPAHCAAVKVLEQGMRITPFVRPWSTTANIESYPFDKGRSVIMSIEHCAKGLVDFDPSIGLKEG